MDYFSEVKLEKNQSQNYREQVFIGAPYMNGMNPMICKSKPKRAWWAIDPPTISHGSQGESQQSTGVEQEKQNLFGLVERPPKGHVLSCKRLEHEGLHTFLGMVGYCMEKR